MSDGPQEYRRASDLDHGTRLTVVEVEMRTLAKSFEKHVEKSDELIAKLDSRADGQDVQMARLLAGLAILIFLGQILAPVIIRFLGLPR